MKLHHGKALELLTAILGGALSEYRILIVEDNPDTRELLQEQLDDPSYEVLTAEDGQDAILRVGERSPHVVIMDVMMPHLDGFETSRYLKLRFGDTFIPVLMLTAKSDLESREQGAEYGCEDYRGKPYTRQQLLSSVECLLDLGVHENLLKAETGEEAKGVVVGRRLELARRLLDEGSRGIAEMHLERVLELMPGHEEALSLQEKVGEIG